MFYIGSDKVEILFSKAYYTLNFVAILVMSALTSYIVKSIPAYINVIIMFGYFAYSLPLIFNKKPQYSDYIKRYIVTIVIVMLNVDTAMYLLRSECILTMPFVIGIVIGNINVIFKSHIIRYLNMVFITSPLIKLFMSVWTIERFAVFICLLSMCVVAHFILASNRRKIESETNAKANFVKEVVGLSADLNNHDLRNELTKMLKLSSKKYRENLPMFLEEFDRCMSNVLKCASFNIFENSDIDVEDITARLKSMISQNSGEFILEIEDNIKLTGNHNIVYSMIKNFIDNSLEAASSNSIKPEIALIKYDNVIEIVDNCGGFDVNKIALGRSSKSGEWHGVFLRTITDPSMQKMFGFKVSIYSMGDGTRIVIEFNQVHV